MKKLRSPYFVSAELMKDGTAKLVDDDGETFHVEMRRDQAWPMLSRMVRGFEMRETGERLDERRRTPPSPPTPFRPKLIK